MAAAETTTATLTEAMKTYYIDTFLTHFKEKLVLQDKGMETSVPLGSGKTVDWYRYHVPALVTSAGTEGLLGSDATFKSFEGMTVQATLTTWYDQFRFSELLHLTSRDARLEKAAQLVGQQAAESIERETLKVLCENNIWPLPANAVNSSTGAILDSVYNEDVTLGTATDKSKFNLSAASLTLASADGTDVLVGGWICVSRGANYGFCSRISTYATVSYEVTLADSAPEAFQTASATYPSKLTVSSPFLRDRALVTGDVLTTEILQKAEEILFKNGAMPFDDGNYICAIHPSVYRHMLNDATWVSAMQQSKLAGLEYNDLGVWSKTKFIRMTTPARYANTAETANSFSSTAGAVYVTLVFGKDAYGVVSLEGRGEPQLKIAIPTPNDNNTENPNSLYGTMGWKLYWIAKPLNANFMVGIFTVQ